MSSAVPETRPVGRNVTVMAFGQLITWTMTLLWTLVVPRSLGPNGLGTIMAAWSITGIFGVVLGLGTRNYLVRESVVEPEAASGLVGTALVMRVLLSPVIIGAAFVYGQIVGWGHDAKTVLYLAAAATIFVQIAEPLQAAFQSLEEMQYLAYSDVISKSGQGLVGIVVVLLGTGIIGVTACWAVMTGLVVLLDLWWLRGRLRIDPRTNVQRMLTMARASLPYWAFGLFFMVYLWIDFVMLSLLTSNKVVGWYAVPTRLFQTLMFVPVVIATAWLPRFVRAFEESPEQLGREARSPTELVLLLSLPIASLTVLASHPLIHLLYGHQYAHSVPVMVGLGLCIPAMYLNIMLAQILIAMNRQAVWTWVMAGSVVINPLFNLALIPWTQHRYGNGAIGASVSLLLTEVVCIGAGYVLIGRLVFDLETARRTVLGLGIAGAMWVVGYWVDAMGPAIPGLVAAALTYVLLARVLRLFTPEEVALMRVGLAKVRNKVPGLRRTVAEAALEAPPTS